MGRPADLGRLSVELDLRAISFEEGLRAGLSVAALIVASDLLGQPILLQAALGALLTCLCDTAGAVCRRIPALLCFAAIGAAMILGFGLARPLGLPLIPIAALGIFVLGFVRIYGLEAQQVGLLLSVVLVLALDRAIPNLAAALRQAGAFAGGALWALVLTMGIWRLHPNRPGRQAVGRVFIALAALCDDLRDLLALPDGPAERHWEQHARAHRRIVRERIELARQVIGERLRAAGGAGQNARQSLLRLEHADVLFRAVIAATDILESTPHAQAGGSALIALLPGVLRDVASQVVDETDAGTAAVQADLARVLAASRTIPAGTPLQAVAMAIADRLRSTLNLAGAAAEPPGEQVGAAGLTDRLIAPILANLSWQSVALRHAARAALVAAAGLLITFAWHGPAGRYQHWLTITLIVTLQPYYAMTLQRALERIGGTVIGGLVAAALTLVCRTPLAIAAAVFPLAVLALSVRRVNFGLYIAALTPTIVLLVELATPGQGHLAIAAMRALYTLIGGALAVLGCIFLWPSWEPGRLDRELRAAVQAHTRYAGLGLAVLRGGAAPGEADVARRSAGLASNNLEASLSRALLEPGAGAARDRLEAALVVDACLRRMAGRLSALQIAHPPGTADAALLQPWESWVTQVGGLLAQSLPPSLPVRPGDLPPDPGVAAGVTRIARQLELSAGALRRYAGG